MIADTLRRVVAWPLALAIALTAALPARAHDFSVYPLRVDFAPGDRSGAVGVNNVDAQPMRFQLKLVEWTQDAEGKDVYRDSDELIFFPRLFTVAPGEQAVARVGPKRTYTGKERTFRLFIEELPDDAEKPKTTGIKFNIRFAVPVFVATQGARPQAVIEPLDLKDGKLTALVRNIGSAHFRIESLEVRGENGFERKAEGWYLLAGATRQHTLDVPRKACLAAKRLEVKVRAGEQLLTAGLDIAPGMCGA